MQFFCIIKRVLRNLGWVHNSWPLNWFTQPINHTWTAHSNHWQWSFSLWQIKNLEVVVCILKIKCWLFSRYLWINYRAKSVTCITKMEGFLKPFVSGCLNNCTLIRIFSKMPREFRQVWMYREKVHLIRWLPRHKCHFWKDHNCSIRNSFTFFQFAINNEASNMVLLPNCIQRFVLSCF